MDFARIAIKNRVVTLVFTVGLLVAGLNAYDGMSRLEDPEFTIKDALVVTPYPGASATEVEEEVTDALEIAVQQLGQLDEVVSKSDRGLSTLTVTIKDQYDRSTLPQVWDELRRKVNDAAGDLPPGAGPSLVVDDYGDVFGVFITITGDGYNYAELKDYVDFLKRELLLVQDVGKISTYGERTEAVYVEFNRDQMSQLGIPTSAIIDELRQKNMVTDSGRVKVGSEFITLQPTGEFTSEKQFESLLISGGDGQQIYLRDVATVRRGYVEPQNTIIQFNGGQAIGMGISTVTGGNVITMGDALKERLEELEGQRPVGIEFGIVSLQSDAVTTAISGFVLSLIEAVAIVIVVLVIFMGMRSAMLIGFILVITIAGSFIVLDPLGVALERISLGALIIALGMLVDNAIVVVDGMLIRMQQGKDAEAAASEIVKQTAWPLLGATIIAILAFAAIGTSNDSTGEFCRSLFTVVMVSLLLSWVTAVTVTPLLGVMFLKVSGGAEGEDPYGGGFYLKYKNFVRLCIRKRYLSVAVVAVVFAVAVFGFTKIEQSFFPPSTRPQFMVDMWLPQGTHIDDTLVQVEEVEQYLREIEGTTNVTSLVGQGGLRFLLTYTPEKLNSAYAQFLVDVDDYTIVDSLMPQIDADLAARYPDTLSYASKFQLGPGSVGKIQARFSGPDPNVLRRLAAEAQAIMRADPDAKSLRTDWRQRVKVVRPVLAEQQANLNGITRPMVATAIKEGFQGVTAGLYREGDLLLPIIVRAEAEQRANIDTIQSLQIWSPAAQAMIPLRQVVSDFETIFEDEIVNRRNRKRTIIAYADPIEGVASELLARVRPQIEAIELPPGYELDWGGEYEDSTKAQGSLAAALPTFIILMVLITIVLFNSLRQPLVIWLCVPLAVIGVTGGLLASGQVFGFMSLLGFLSLIGMLIKNAIVLVDQINVELSQAKELVSAIVDAGASRLRPVAMAASTTALGMIPLLPDAFFVAMAITIIGGLMVASVLTMVVVPVFYSIIFKAPIEAN